MRSLILIPAYLLRNSLHRWLENPASPTTKFLIPFLFGLLGLMVFGLMRGIETELENQLTHGDLRTLQTSEYITAEDAATRYYEAMEESSIWEPYCSRIDLFFQLPIVASSGSLLKIPVLAYTETPSFLDIPAPPAGEARHVILFVAKNSKNQSELLNIQNYQLSVKVLPMPEKLQQIYRINAMAFVPAEMMEVPLLISHTQIQILEPKAEISTRDLETLILNYSEAERCNIRIQSSGAIIERLNQFITQQKYVRIILGGSIAVILSLVLGSLSLLEFRQELYLFALLQSLGVRRIQLIVHYLLETILITFAGGLSALLCSQYITSTLLNKSPTIMGKSGQSISLDIATIASVDLVTIAGSILTGVALSSLPFILGLRKQPGLMLQ